MNDLRITARLVFLILMCLWAGIIIGVSLLATPVKFQAPSLTTQVGLEIGRYTFRLLSRVELCLAIVTIAIAYIAQPRWLTVVALALVVIAVALQRYWLLPTLDRRVSQILTGAPPLFSIQHTMYAVMEAAKAALLIAGAVAEFRPCSR